MGELKVGCTVFKRMSGALSDKHFIDASVTRSATLNVALTDLGTGVTHLGQQVYISQKGQELLEAWRATNQMPGGFKLVVWEDSAIRDWFWNYREEDVQQ